MAGCLTKEAEVCFDVRMSVEGRDWKLMTECYWPVTMLETIVV